jgi:hypothetical protein
MEWVLSGVLNVVCLSNTKAFDVPAVAMFYAPKVGERDTK